MQHHDHHGGWGHGRGGSTEVFINFGGGYETPRYEPTPFFNEAYGGCFGNGSYGSGNYNSYYNNYYGRWNGGPQVCQPQDYISMMPAPYPMDERPPVIFSRPVIVEPMYPIYPRHGLGVGFGGRHWHVGLFI